MTVMGMLALTVLAAIIIENSAFMQDILYIYDESTAEKVVSAKGQKLYSAVLFLAIAYHFLRRASGERQWNKMLPVAVLLMALPMQLMLHAIGMKAFLLALSGSWFYIGMSYVLGLSLKMDVAKYRLKLVFILILILLLSLLSIMAAPMRNLFAFVLPLLTILFGILAVVEAQRMKNLLSWKITEDNVNDFYFSCIANLYFNFIGSLAFFTPDKVIYKLIVTDKDNEY